MIDARKERKETIEDDGDDGYFKAKVFSISPLEFSCTYKLGTWCAHVIVLQSVLQLEWYLTGTISELSSSRSPSFLSFVATEEFQPI